MGMNIKTARCLWGLHKKGSTYDVLTASDCKLVHEDMTKILSCVLAYFKEQKIELLQKNAAHRLSEASSIAQGRVYAGRFW